MPLSQPQITSGDHWFRHSCKTMNLQIHQIIVIVHLNESKDYDGDQSPSVMNRCYDDKWENDLAMFTMALLLEACVYAVEPEHSDGSWPAIHPCLSACIPSPTIFATRSSPATKSMDGFRSHCICSPSDVAKRMDTRRETCARPVSFVILFA